MTVSRLDLASNHGTQRSILICEASATFDAPALPKGRGDITFMIHEQSLAFNRAAAVKGLARQDMENVSAGNAHRLFWAS